MNTKTKVAMAILFSITLLLVASSFLPLSTSPAVKGMSLRFSTNIHLDPESEGLRQLVIEDLQDQPGTFAVYIENLTEKPPVSTQSGQIEPKRKEKYLFQEKESFPTASLYKLVLLAAVMQEVENGKWNLEGSLTSTQAHLKEVFGDIDFGYEEMPEIINFSVEEALQRVGSISDNFAAIMLTEKLREKSGLDPLTVMADKLEMENTHFGGIPTTTAEDVAIFFKALYNGSMVSQTASQKIIELLSRSKINNRIPAQIPKEVKVVHKTGELSHLRHDGGIVYLEGNPYVLVILAKDLPFEDDGVETIAKLSKDVFDYFKLLK